MNPSKLNIAICTALGLDPAKVRSLVIRLQHDQAPVVEVVQLVEDADGVYLREELKRCDLVPKP